MTKPMTNRIRVVALCALAALCLSVKPMSTRTSASIQPRNTQPAPSQVFDQAQALADLRKAIAGKEDKPAAEVFKNIQMLKTMPAGRLLRVMELGYSKSLGVNCIYCHAAPEWEKEDKLTKQVTRDMAAMVANINNEELKKIKNLRSAEPVINCTTCHRGQAKPALNLPN